MHILFLAQRVPFPPNKGEKLRTFYQLEYLRRQGHIVSVVAPYTSNNELQYFDELKDNYCKHVISQKLANKYVSLGMGILKNQSLSVANFYNKKLQRKLDVILQQESVDTIICSASSMAEYVFQSHTLNKLQSSPKLIMDFMDLDSDKWRQYAEKSSLAMKLIYAREEKLLSQYEGKIAQDFDDCFFITDSEVNLFKQNHSQYHNVISIENGIDKSAFFPPDIDRKIDTPVFLFAGVMDYPPNIDAVNWFVDNVWPKVVDKWPSAKFYIAGMNPTDKMKQLSGGQGIEVTGFVEDIKPYFDQANIFVAPFRLARGVQNKVLQAFACGLPVVATSMGAEGIRYTESKDILLADTPEKFIQQITKLVDESTLYQSISKEALKTIDDHYSWDSILAPLNNLVAKK